MSSYKGAAYVGDSASVEYDRGDNELTSDVIVSAVSSDEYDPVDKSVTSEYENDGLATWRQVLHHCCGYSSLKGWSFFFFQAFSFFTCLYLFFTGMVLLASSAQVVGGCSGATLLANNFENPLSNVMAGIIVTSLFQSSAVTNILIGSLVGNRLTVQQGIYMAMGANLGNTMTNSIFALVHIKGKSALERAIAGASINDIFYMLTLAIMLPLEIASQMLYRISKALVSNYESTGFRWDGLIQTAVAPLANKIIIANEEITKAFFSGEIGSCEELYEENKAFNSSKTGLIVCDENTGSCPAFFSDEASQKSDQMKGALTLGIALVVIFSCLYGMIFLINRMLISLPIEVIAKVTNMTTIPSMITGCVVGLLMGNSSVTESMMTPFVGTGIVELEQMFPWSLGANIGLSLATMLTALHSGNGGFVQVSIANLLFNVLGILLWFPFPVMRTFPLHGALILGILSNARRIFPLIYICVTFLGVPLMLISIVNLMDNESKGIKALGFILLSVFMILLMCGCYWWFRMDGRNKFLTFFNNDDSGASNEGSMSDVESVVGNDEEGNPLPHSGPPPAPAGILRNRSVDPQMIKQRLSVIGPKSRTTATKFKQREKRKTQSNQPRTSKVCCTETERDPNSGLFCE